MNKARINGADLAFTDSGPRGGTPVVLSHSLFFDHTMFEPLSAILVAKGLRVIAPDHRNHGESDHGTRAEVSVDRLTEDLAGLMRHLELGRAHVVGNSMGGFVALRLAVRHPELLLSAAALGSSAEEEHQLEAFAPLVEVLCQHGAPPVLDNLMFIMFGDTSLASRGPVVASWRERMSKLGTSIGDSAYEVIHRKRIVEELRGCKVPVLAVAGLEDHAYPPPISSDNIARATGGKTVSVAAAGHSVSLEQPDMVARHLLEHFASVGAPSS